MFNFLIAKREDNMKKLLTIIPLVFLLCFTFGCQQGEEVAEEVEPIGLTDEDVAAIKQMLLDEETLLLADDWEGFSQLYTEDVLLMPPNAPTVRGREALLQMFAGFTITEFSSSIEEVYGCGDIAFGRGIFSWTFSVEGSTEAMSDSGKFVGVWKKQPDGKWLVAVNIWNSDLPLSQ
jgi:ketosteroid isomerase-like protein